MFNIGFLFVCSILLHEFMHLYTLNKYDKTARIEIYKKLDLLTTNKGYLEQNQELRVLNMGVFVGMLPFVIIFAIAPWWLSLILFGMYIFGSYSDLKEIMRLIK